MSDNEIRDRLADIINTEITRQVEVHASYISALYETEVADAVLAAGWRPSARVIETAEELDALPDGTVIRDRYGRIGERDEELCHELGTEVSGLWESVNLPAVVLWQPEMSADA